MSGGPGSAYRVPGSPCSHCRRGHHTVCSGNRCRVAGHHPDNRDARTGETVRGAPIISVEPCSCATKGHPR